MWRRDATTDASSGLAGLLQSLPADASPYDYIRHQLNDPVWTAQTGWFYAQTWIFMCIHIVVATLSLLGCWKRYTRGTLWWFRRSDGYIHPNTSVLSQVSFALYSLLYIVSLAMETLTPPTGTKFFLPYLAYVWLGLAIHFQTWATVFARPRSSASFSSTYKHFLDSSSPFSRRLGPSVLNSIVIGIGLGFVVSVLVGSSIQLVHKVKMIRALMKINASLDEAEVTNAALTSLLALLPVFTTFMEEGARLSDLSYRCSQIWACWGIIWIASYPAAAVSLILTLTQQERHLIRSLSNYADVDALASRPPEVYRPPRSSTSSSTKPSGLELVPSTEKLPQSPQEGGRGPARVDLPTIAFRRSSVSAEGTGRDRTAAQKEETLQKLSGVKRVKLVVIIQLATTFEMLIVYGALEINIFLPWFKNLPPQTMNNAAETWLGWAFALPGMFSAFAFFWASLHTSQPRRQRPSLPSRPSQIEPFLPTPASPTSAIWSPIHPVTSSSFASPLSSPPSLSSGRSLDLWRSFRSQRGSPSVRSGEEAFSAVGGEGREGWQSGWKPSAWAREKNAEAILMEVRRE